MSGVRTDINTVKGVIPTQLSDSEITLLITQANLMVTRQVGGEGLTAALLKDLETWLTAHLISIGKERQPIEERVGEIWLQYKEEGTTGFLNLSTYGQTVLFMDTSGQFQAGTKQRASFIATKQIQD